ncbi:alpha/beta fold hydrolase [Pseudomaricurvus alkylphenolicus]|uniref:alpha/beta fold hydrolase n=1 Tax=Pseudomaricurvus alkylphenolicus TaxID=1306991 RepID=UPI001420CBE0|nr:alpha/beta fold hydrolase [Pseudomaricurvus alkylphenolicus]NIB40293.1 alpha/beta fold hydrolase [Pseudomaricurvus alkylphenolicus]
MVQLKQNLVLIPGMLCNGLMWEPQICALESSANIIVADLTKHSDLHSMATGILASAPPTFSVAGLSMGGYVALELFRQAPDRIEKLALLNTNAHEADPVNEIPSCRGMLERLKSGDGLAKVAKDLVPALFSEEKQDDPELEEIVIRMADSVGYEALERQISAVISRPDSLSLLPQIKNATLVIGAQNDVLTPPEEHEQIASLIPQSKLTILERCGHLSTLERPNTISMLLREWLTSG